MAAALAILPAAAPAEMELLERIAASDGLRISIKWTPRSIPEAVTADEPSPDPAAYQAESALIPLPWAAGAVDSGIVRAQEAWNLKPGGVAPGDVVAEAVVFGGVPALRLFLRPDRPLPAGEEFQLRLTVAAPRQTASASKPLRRLTHEEQRDLAPFFLTPPLHAVEARRRTSLPEAPAPLRVTYDQGDRLHSLAADGGATPTLQLIHHGTPLPWLERDGRVWFFAPYRHTLTDRQDAVFINSAPAPPAMATRPAFPTLAPEGQEVPQLQTERFREHLIYERSTPTTLGDRVVYYRLGRGQQRVTQLPITDRFTTSTAALAVENIGLTRQDASDPDHYAEYALQGNYGPERFSWDGAAEATHGLDAVASPLPDGTQAGLAFHHRIPVVSGGPTSDFQNLKAVTVTWTGHPRLRADGRRTLTIAQAPDGQPRRATIGGLPPGTAAAEWAVLDVTDPTSPVLLQNPSIFTSLDGAPALEVEIGATTTVLHVERWAAAPAPLQPAPTVGLPDATGHFVAGVVVCPAPLQPAIGPLLDHHGGDYVLLDPQAAYDAYNGGQQSPDAIRSAVRDIFDAAEDHPAFPAILLVGHGTFDQRNHLGFGTATDLPFFVEPSVDTGFTIESSVDAPYAYLWGGDELPDAAVGRLPAKSAGELETMVARIIAHAGAAPALQSNARPALFAYDNDPGIVGDGARWAAFLEDSPSAYEELVLANGTDGVAEKADLLSRLESPATSPAFLTYSGHGSNTLWANEQLLSTADLPGITTDGRWPVIATFTCLNGYYAFPGSSVRCFGEAWLLGPQETGAPANIAPTGVDFYSLQREFMEGFFEQWSEDNRPLTIGRMFHRAQLRFALDFPELGVTWRNYLLFGDPGTPVPIGKIPPAGLPREEWRLLSQ